MPSEQQVAEMRAELIDQRRLTAHAGWDSYDARAIAAETWDRAEALLWAVHAATGLLPDVDPLGCGSVDLNWVESEFNSFCAEVPVTEGPFRCHRWGPWTKFGEMTTEQVIAEVARRVAVEGSDDST